MIALHWHYNQPDWLALHCIGPLSLSLSLFLWFSFSLARSISRLFVPATLCPRFPKRIYLSVSIIMQNVLMFASELVRRQPNFTTEKPPEGSRTLLTGGNQLLNVDLFDLFGVLERSIYAVSTVQRNALRLS